MEQVYQLILAGKLAFPRFMDKNAKSLVKKLLVADLTKRYGCVKGGAQDIKSHKWFTGFDFEALLSRQIPAPIVPQVLRSFAVFFAFSFSLVSCVIASRVICGDRMSLVFSASVLVRVGGVDVAAVVRGTVL